MSVEAEVLERTDEEEDVRLDESGDLEEG